MELKFIFGFKELLDKKYKSHWELFDNTLCSSHFPKLQTVNIVDDCNKTDRNEIQNMFKGMLPKLYQQGILATSFMHESEYTQIV